MPPDENTQVETSPETVTQEIQTTETQTQETQTQETQETQTQETPAALTIDDIKLPDGFTPVPDEIKSEFVEILNDAEKTPQQRMEALVGLQSKVMTESVDAIREAWNDQQTKWQEEVKADPVVGGANMTENLAQVSKLIETFGSAETDATKKAAEVEDLRKALDHTGAGNHPAVVRFLFRVAKELNEPTAVQGNPAATTASAASKLFPTMAASGG